VIKFRINPTGATTGTYYLNSGTSCLQVVGTVTATPPTIGTPSPTSLSGFTTTQGTASTSQTFTITGSNLAVNLVCASQSTQFELREQGTIPYSSSVSFTPSSGAVSKTVEVRLAASASVGTPSSSVLISSGTASTQSVALSGTVSAGGTPDCQGVVGGSALPGTPCTDSDPCTINETYLANCTCVGIFQDTDGDGVCNANDNCPNQAGQIGSSCNDNDACTTGDVVNSSCVCSGTTDNTDSDGDGVPNCQDGCPNDPSKIFAGACGCGVLEVGNVCDDGNACTINDVYTSCGVCAGTAPAAYWNFGTTTENAAPTTNGLSSATPGSLSGGNSFGATTLLTTTSASNNSGASGQYNAGIAARAGALNTDPNGSAYFEFTVTPSSGHTFTLVSISFGTRCTATGPVSYSLRSSTNAYASEVAGGSITPNSIWSPKSNFGLSATSNGDQPITFRLYGYGSAGNPGSGTVTWRIDDLSISGCAGTCQDSDGDGLCDSSDPCQATAAVTGSPMFNAASCGANPGAYLTYSTINSLQVATAISTCPGGNYCTGGTAQPATCSNCAAGSYTNAACSSSTDTQCSSCNPVAHCVTPVQCSTGTNSQCASCGSGYYLQDGVQDQCLACTAIPNCVSALTCTDATNSQCTTCAAGYTVVGGQCQLDSDGDGIADSSDPCQATSAVTSSPLFNPASCGANPGAYLTYSTINSLQVATAISTCPGGNYCTGGTAQPVTCSNCASGSYSSAACTSTTNTECATCTDVVHCATAELCTTGSDSQCATCQSGYYLSDGVADQCLACTPVPNCISSITCTNGSDSQCLTCQDGYHLSNGQCVACTDVAFCVTPETCTSASNSQCAACASGRYLNESGPSDVCASCTPVAHCVSALTCTAASNSQCATCGSGYFLQDGIADNCVACTAVPNCVSALTCTDATNSQCTTCAAGYTVLGGQCVLDSDGDGIADGSDPCEATSNVTSSPLFNAASCGASPGAYLSYSTINSLQVATDISTCPAGSYCTGGTAPALTCAAGSYASTTGQSTCATCDPACSAGEYPSATCTPTTNSECGTCDATCATCNGAGNGHCTSCDAGRVLSSGQCLLDSDGDGTEDGSDACEATSSVTSSPMFNAATCGANPGAYLTYSTINSLQVATEITTCPAGSSCTGGTAPAELCPAGKFSDQTGSVACLSCAAGYHSSSTGSTSCAACAAGTYNPTTGQVECLTCSGTTNTPTGATECTTSRIFTVTNSGGTTTGCLVTSTPAGIDCGTICSSSFPDGSLVTLHAQASLHHVFLGWSGACTGTGDCVTTMDADKSATALFDLDSDDDGIPDSSDDCEATTAVSGSPMFDATSCGANPGAYLTYSDVSGVQVATDISTCPAGSYCTGGTAASVPCPAGKFSDQTGSAACLSCAAGYHSSSTGSTSCAACAAGTYNPTTGQVECLTCNGTTNTPTGATECSTSFSFTVTNQGGVTTGCLVTSTPAGIDCGTICSSSFPAGSLVTLHAQASLHHVFLGWSGACTGTGDCVTTMDADKSATALFDLDSDDDGLPDSVDDCEATTSVSGSPLFDATSCGANPGAYLTYSDVSGVEVATDISTCPAGSYCTGGTAPSALCPAGKFSDQTGSVACLSCAAGYHSSSTGSTSCAACAAGTYNPSTGQVECLTCTGGTNAPTGAAVCLDYPGSPYCPSGTAMPELSGGQPGSPYTCSNGQCSSLVMDPATGEVDLEASAPGTYTVCSNGACVELVIRPTAILSMPTISLSSGTNPTCSSSPVEFHALGTYMDGSSYDSDVSYVWSDGGGTIPGGAFFAISNPVSGMVSVSVTTARECASSTPVSSSNSIDLVVTPTLTLVPSTLSIDQTLGTPSTCSGSPMEFTLSGMYSDGSSASNDLSATWTDGVITITGSGFSFTADASSSSVSVSDVTSSRTCVSNSGIVAPPAPVSLSVTPSVTFSSVSLELSSGTNPTCSGTSRQFTALGHFSDNTDLDSRPPAETQYDFYLGGALVQSSHSPLYEDAGTGENPLYVTVASSRPCLSGPVFLTSTTIQLQVQPTVLFVLDADDDDYYVTGSEVSGCNPPSSLYKALSAGVTAGDCDDSRADVHPLAAEKCDDRDNDCNSNTPIDDGCDDDDDGYCDFSMVTTTSSTCASGGGDCNDQCSSCHPNGVEVCDDLDQDCDGSVDDGVTSTWYPDTDGDGYGCMICTGVSSCSPPSTTDVLDHTDCDDTRSTVHPFATEQCDDLDNDCNSATALDDGCDDDDDGYCDFSMVTTTSSTCANGGGDCADTDATRNPGATEVCDPSNLDEDCDGSSTNGLIFQDYAEDADGDNYWKTTTVVNTCAPGFSPLLRSVSEMVANGGGPDDCDDTNASVHPFATEQCDDLDNDCNSATALDDGCDNDDDGYCDAGMTTLGVFQLRNTNSAGAADIVVGYGAPGLTPLAGNWDGQFVSPGVYDPATGTFFLKNSNSGGSADLVFTFGTPGVNYQVITGDWDGDGIDTPGLYDPVTGSFFLRNSNSNGPADLTFTFGPVGAAYVPVKGDWDGDGDDTVGLYDPATGSFFLKNTNTPGNADNVFSFGSGGQGLIPLIGDWNGDGTDTVGLYDTTTGSFFLKNSNSGGNADFTFTYGAGGQGYIPVAGDWDLDGDDTVGLYGSPSTCSHGSGDCDDTSSSVHPGATEVCDPSDVDEDCDGLVNEGDNVFFVDADGDGYGSSASVSLVCTSPPTGYADNDDDCDDSDDSRHPGASEVCDGVDQDCDSDVDEGDNVYFHDGDSDGYGDFALSVSVVCSVAPSGYVDNDDDCDDSRADVSPGDPEICDPSDVDEDCDGLVNEGDNVYFIDSDDDGYGSSSSSVSLVCTSPPDGYVDNDDDCDDGDDSRHPGADEVCDGVDQDCDSDVDEGSNVYYRDADGDTFGDFSVAVSLVCTSPPPGFVTTAGDCDDAHLLYADTDGDGIGAGAPVACGVLTNTDNCPSVQGQIGSPCDDGNAATTNDVLNSSCVCAGTVTCVTNPVALTVNTDAHGAQISWYVMYTGTNTEVCSGHGLPDNTAITVSCCLPNGCYDLVITDDFGDGIIGGGYVLRDGSGKRIIDNAGNGASFTTLSLSPLGFCVPMSTDALMASSCDVENATLTTVLRAELNPAVTAQFGSHNTNSGYQYWVTNPHGGFSRRLLLTHSAPGTGAPAGTPNAQKASWFALSSMNSSAPLIPQGILLNIRVRTQVNGVYGNFGPACRLIIPTPTCATTQLTTTATPTISCGATGLSFSSVIWANAVSGATGYQFEFSKPGYTRRILSPTRSQALSFVTVPLQMNNCYQVRVRISYDNSSTYCPFGPYCNITLGTATCNSGMALDEGSDGTSTAEEARLTLWPNPNDGSTMNVSLTEFDATVNVVTMDVTDVFGKLVSTRTLPVQDGYLNTAISFERELAPGLYLVNLQAGEHRYTERLVIQ
jgi:hypothetical protein